MAHAIAEPQPSTMTFRTNGFDQQYVVTFVGADVQTPDNTQQTGVTASFDFDDTNDTLRRKVRDAVIQAAREYGFTVATVQAQVLITV